MLYQWTILRSAVILLTIYMPVSFSAPAAETSNNSKGDLLVNSLDSLENKASQIKSFINEVSKDKDSEKSKISEYDKLILTVIYSLREDGNLFTDFTLLLLDKLYPNKTDTFNKTFEDNFSFPESDIINVLKYLNSSKDSDDIPQHALDSLFLVIYMSPIDKFNKTIIEYGLEKGYANGVKRLLGKRPINEKGDTLLHIAAQNDYLESLNVLLDSGLPVDVKNKEGQTPLYYAVKNEHQDAVKLLKSKGANIESRDENGDTQLHIAAKLGDIDAAVSLIEAGAKVDSENEGQTPLYRAAQFDRGNMMSVLLGNGANLHFSYQEKELIHKAAALNDTLAVKNLLRFEVKVDTNSKDGTPLHWAARGGHKELVKFLLAQGANVNAKSSFSKTPLHEAAYWANYDIARILIEHGANITAKDNSWRTPADFANDNDQHAMRNLLKSFEKRH